MEMDVEGVSPRPEPIPRSQGAGGACQAPPQPPQPQPQPQPPPPPPPQPQPQQQPQPQPQPQQRPQQPAQDEVPGESAGAEDSDDPEATPGSDRGESKRYHGLKGDGYPNEFTTRSQRFQAIGCSKA